MILKILKKQSIYGNQKKKLNFFLKNQTYLLAESLEVLVITEQFMHICTIE